MKKTSGAAGLLLAGLLCIAGPATAGILHDNGPLITNPGAGAGGANVSAVAEGGSTFGFNAGGYWLADDFSVPAGGWMIDSVTLFAYETGSPITSSLTGAYVQIWDGPPDDPASTVVFGDTDTNRMIETWFMWIYRTSQSNLANADRPIMGITAEVDTYLPAGTYWVGWRLAGSLGSGPWVPPVTIVGQPGKPGSNAILLGSEGWGPIKDTASDAPQDMPFVIQGDVVSDLIFADGFELIPF